MRHVDPVCSVFGTGTCISISWQIDEISFIVDQKKIHQLRFSWLDRSFGKRAIVSERIDER